MLVYLYFKYTNIVNTWDPKCTGNWIWICSYRKSWWWLCRAETCSLECVFNSKLDLFDWKNLHFVYFQEHIGMTNVKFTLLYLTIYNISELCGNNRFLSPTQGSYHPWDGPQRWYECSFHWEMVSVVVQLCFGNGANENDCEVVHFIQNWICLMSGEINVFCKRFMKAIKLYW